MVRIYLSFSVIWFNLYLFALYFLTQSKVGSLCEKKLYLWQQNLMVILMSFIVAKPIVKIVCYNIIIGALLMTIDYAYEHYGDKNKTQTRTFIPAKVIILIQMLLSKPGSFVCENLLNVLSIYVVSDPILPCHIYAWRLPFFNMHYQHLT